MPERPEFVAQLEKEVPYYHIRHLIKSTLLAGPKLNSDRGGQLLTAKKNSNTICII
ncbi:MAG: hypothetical protein QME61_01975 [Patescibacteria group bacterium]|nr:hypothetical protein [Patescibacteria group bacterium]